MNKSTHSESRRRFVAALASGGLVAPALLTDNLARAATVPPFEVRLAPKYYPTPKHAVHRMVSVGPWVWHYRH